MSTLRTVGGAGTDEKIRLVTKMLLAANGMTTLELGRRLGLGRTPIYDRMQGRKPFTVTEVATMAEMFGVPVSLFFRGPSALLGRDGEGLSPDSSRRFRDEPAEVDRAA